MTDNHSEENTAVAKKILYTGNPSSLMREAGNKQHTFFRRAPKACPLKAVPDEQIHFTNLRLISMFISERGRILPTRITAISAKKQRLLKKAIKIARFLGLLPFVQKNK